MTRYGARPADISWSAALPSLLTALLDSYGDLDTANEYFDAMVKNKRWCEPKAIVSLRRRGAVMRVHGR